MVTDIVKGTFKGFALLRQITNPGGARAGPLANPMAQPRPVYAPGYGLIPPSQVSTATRHDAAVPGAGVSQLCRTAGSKSSCLTANKDTVYHHGVDAATPYVGGPFKSAGSTPPGC